MNAERFVDLLEGLTLIAAIAFVVFVAHSGDLHHVRKLHSGFDTQNTCLEYNDLDVHHRLCVESEGAVLYTQGRGSSEPVREVIK